MTWQVTVPMSRQPGDVPMYQVYQTYPCTISLGATCLGLVVTCTVYGAIRLGPESRPAVERAQSLSDQMKSKKTRPRRPCGTKPRPRPLCALLFFSVFSSSYLKLHYATTDSTTHDLPQLPQTLLFVARSVFCPAPAGPWTNAQTKRRPQSPDSVSADCATPETLDLLHPRPRFPLQDLFYISQSRRWILQTVYVSCDRRLFMYRGI